MVLGVLLLIIPVGIYLALVLVPQGRFWGLVCALVALMLTYIWLGYLLSWKPLWTGNPRSDAYTFAAANLYTLASVAGAATGFFGRRLAQRSDKLSYPVIVVGTLMLIFIPLFLILGV